MAKKRTPAKKKAARKTTGLKKYLAKVKRATAVNNRKIAALEKQAHKQQMAKKKKIAVNDRQIKAIAMKIKKEKAAKARKVKALKKAKK